MPTYLNEYVYAFNLLSPSRSVGFSRQSITLSEIVCYTKEFGTPNGFRIFIEIIQAIDQSFLEYTNKENVKCTD